MITLALPLALGLLPLPALMRLWPRPDQYAEAMLLPPGIAEAAQPMPAPGRRGVFTTLLLAWAALCLALAQPERIVMIPDDSASGRDIVFALDMSGSMSTRDFALDGAALTRLQAVKTVAGGFIRARRGDRIGLVIFADRAFLAAPLTYDLQTVIRALDEAEIGLAGRSTNISEGLGLALKKALAEPSKSKAVILLSDGRDSAKRLDPVKVAELARSHALRIHTVALGPDDLETQPAARDAVDIETLRAIAAASGGETFRVRSMADLEAMAKSLDRLEPNPALRPPVAISRALWPWAAALAMLLSMAAVAQAVTPMRFGRMREQGRAMP